MIFDLDGTLVQTEKLKAQSYAHAAIELCGSDPTQLIATVARHHSTDGP